MQLKEKLLYMFRSVRDTKQEDIYTHTNIEKNEVKLTTSRLKFLNCKTV